LIFGVCLMGLGLHRLFTGKAVTRDGTLPGPALQRGIATGIGTLSSLMGIGGGVLGVLVLTRAGHAVHRAIGTASGFGLFIGFAGALGYMVVGLDDPAVTGATFGYISVPAFIAIATGTFTMAPLGAKTAARLSSVLLTRLFASYMIISAALMIKEAL
ncbi:MAG: TSUP family transporter, partial [Pseudomonadota bacterium]